MDGYSKVSLPMIALDNISIDNLNTTTSRRGDLTRQCLAQHEQTVQPKRQVCVHTDKVQEHGLYPERQKYTSAKNKLSRQKKGAGQ